MNRRQPGCHQDLSDIELERDRFTKDKIRDDKEMIRDRARQHNSILPHCNQQPEPKPFVINLAVVPLVWVQYAIWDPETEP